MRDEARRQVRDEDPSGVRPLRGGADDGAGRWWRFTDVGEEEESEGEAVSSDGLMAWCWWSVRVSKLGLHTYTLTGSGWKLPAIVDGRFKQFESHAILIYLASAFPGIADHWLVLSPFHLFNHNNFLMTPQICEIQTQPYSPADSTTVSLLFSKLGTSTSAELRREERENFGEGSSSKCNWRLKTVVGIWEAQMPSGNWLITQREIKASCCGGFGWMG
ncbi:hypothetical protein S83_039192 [Arachis hypogaea]